MLAIIRNGMPYPYCVNWQYRQIYGKGLNLTLNNAKVYSRNLTLVSA